MLWQVWWVWVAGGFLLGVLEVLAPGFIFLGFALGAVLVALPVMVALLFINVGLGVVTRAAPSLNIFAVGFPAMISRALRSSRCRCANQRINRSIRLFRAIV